jgi:hypothetical protein
MAEKMEIRVTETGVSKVRKNFDNLSDSLNNAKNNVLQMRIKTSGLRRVIGAVRNEILLFTFATSGLIRIMKSAVDAFSKFEQASTAIELSFNKMGDAVVFQLNRAAEGTVSAIDLIMSANRTMALNVTTDVNKMATLLQYARIRARAMGITTTQAFNDIATGIGRQSPKILDNLGIIIKGWNEEAKAAGVAYDAQFILNKVLGQAAIEIENTGDMSLTTAERMNQLSASWSNLKVAIGQTIAEDNATWFTELADSINYLTKQIKGESQVFMSGAEIVAQMSGENVTVIEAEIRQRHRMIESTKEYQSGVRSLIKDQEKELKVSMDKVKHGKLSEVQRKLQLDHQIELQNSLAELRKEANGFSDEQINAWQAQKEALEAYIAKLERAYNMMQQPIAVFETAEISKDYFAKTDDMWANSTENRLKASKKLADESGEYLTDSTAEWLRNFQTLFGQTMDATTARWGAWAGMFSDVFYEAFGGSFDSIEDYFNNMLKRMAADLAASGLINLLNPAAGGVGMFGAQGLFGFLGFKNGGNVSNRGGRPVKAQSGYNGIVPPGYPNDSFPIMVQSGEHVNVTSSGNTRNGFDGVITAINDLKRITARKPVANTQVIGDASLYRTVKNGQKRSGSLWN